MILLFGHYPAITVTPKWVQITSVSIVCSTVCSATGQRKRQSSASLAFVREIHWPLVNSPHKGPVTRKTFPFDDVTMAFVHLIRLCQLSLIDYDCTATGYISEQQRIYQYGAYLQSSKLDSDKWFMWFWHKYFDTIFRAAYELHFYWMIWL